MTIKAIAGIVSMGAALFFFTAEPATAQLYCACYDPATGPQGSDVFQTNEPNCVSDTRCSTCSADRNCALCQTSGGGVDCGLSGGGAGSSGACPISDFTIEGVLRTLSCNFNRIIPFLVLLATALFLWGIVRHLTAGGDEEQLKNARRLIIAGILGLAVIVAVWGFVAIVIDLIFGSQTIPTIPGSNIVDKI